jgi:hypothetical protein
MRRARSVHLPRPGRSRANPDKRAVNTGPLQRAVKIAGKTATRQALTDAFAAPAKTTAPTAFKTCSGISSPAHKAPAHLAATGSQAAHGPQATNSPGYQRSLTRTQPQ